MTGASGKKKIKKDVVLAVAGALFVTVLIVINAFYQVEPIERVQRTRILMSTYVTITVYAPLEEAEDAIEAAFEKIKEVSMAASTFDEKAEAYRLNEDGRIAGPSMHIREILNRSKEYYEMTNRSFDITIEPLLDLWRIKPWPEAYLLFDINSTFTPDLANGTVPAELKDMFDDNGYPLTEDALVMENEGTGWLIEERLFTLPVSYRERLDLRPIYNELHGVFTENGQSLTRDAGIIEISGKRWNLTDGRKRYIIEDAGGHLVVAVDKFCIVNAEPRLNVTTQFWDMALPAQLENINIKKSLMGCDRIAVSPHEIRFEEEGMKITLGGIAKGYAVDEAIKVLKKRGIKHGMVNAGGDIATIRDKPRGGKWTVALENPKDTSEFITHFEVEGKSICTSGNYLRYFDPEAKVGHIMDPRTGFSVSHCMSVTIISDDCTTADVLATSVFVMGPKEGMDLINKLDDVEGLIIDSNKTIYRSQGLAVYEKPLF